MRTGLWIYDKRPGFLLLVDLSTVAARLHNMVLVAACMIEVSTLLTGCSLCSNTSVGVLSNGLFGFRLRDRLTLVSQSVILAGKGRILLIEMVMYFNPVDEILERFRGFLLPFGPEEVASVALGDVSEGEIPVLTKMKGGIVDPVSITHDQVFIVINFILVGKMDRLVHVRDRFVFRVRVDEDGRLASSGTRL